MKGAFGFGLLIFYLTKHLRRPSSEAQVAAGHNMKELGFRMEQTEFKAAQRVRCTLCLVPANMYM